MDAIAAKDKIDKTIELGSSANENESAAALDKAEELLKKYSKYLDKDDREKLANKIRRKKERIKYNKILENFFTELKTVSYEEALSLCRKVKNDFFQIKDESIRDNELMENIQKQLLFYKATVENPKRIRELLKMAKKEDVKLSEVYLKEAQELAEEMIGTPSEDKKIIAVIDRKRENVKRQIKRYEKKDNQRFYSEDRHGRKEQIQNREGRQFYRRARRNGKHDKRCERHTKRPKLRMVGGSTLKVFVIIGTIACFFWAVVFSFASIAMISSLVDMVKEANGFVWATMYDTLLFALLPVPLYVGGGLLRWVRNNPLEWFKPW